MKEEEAARAKEEMRKRVLKARAAEPAQRGGSGLTRAAAVRRSGKCKRRSTRASTG
jgi:hypothetical protein